MTYPKHKVCETMEIDSAWSTFKDQYLPNIRFAPVMF